MKDLLRELRRIKQVVEREVETRSGMPTALTTAPPEEVRPAHGRWWMWAAALLVLSLVGAASAWQRFGTKPETAMRGEPLAAERTFEYWLTVQKMHDGKAFDSEFNSSGQEIFGDGWKFRFNFRNDAGGFLYLLNHGPGSGGQYTLRLLYPMPSSTQGVGSGESDWFVFDENAGTEKFWIVWSAKPLPEMQEALRFVNKNDFGEVKDAALTAKIEGILNQYASGISFSKDSLSKRTVVKGRGDVLAIRAELEHH